MLTMLTQPSNSKGTRYPNSRTCQMQETSRHSRVTSTETVCEWVGAAFLVESASGVRHAGCQSVGADAVPRGRASGVERRPSDQNDEVTVSGQNRVGRHKLERLSHGLRHQQPVEGVVVVLVQSGHPGGVRRAHR
jgi:hypothetical protein